MPTPLDTFDISEHSGVDSAELFPLTTSQKLIYAGQQLQPDDPLYNMVMVFKIKGPVERGPFEQAFQTLVNNCDALRTVFSIQQGKNSAQPEMIQQRVLTHVDASLGFIDLTGDASAKERLDQWLAEHKLKRFDIHQCLFESALFKLADNEYCWYLNQHHLLTDAWSMGVLFERMQHFYTLAQQNSLHQAQSLPRFSNYVNSEIKAQQSKRFSSAQKYWQTELNPTVQASSFYHSRPPTRSSRTNRITCEFGTQRSAQLKQLANLPEFAAFSSDLGHMQLFSTLLFTYLHRVSGNTLLTVGTPTHSRTTHALKETAGMLINIFPLQLEIDSQDSFTGLYQKVAEANQRLLINAVPGSTQVEHNRLFDVVLNYIPSAFADFGGMQTETEWLHADYGDRNHLLRLQVHNFQQDDAFTLYFDLNEEMFASHECRDLCEHFLALTDAFLENPNEKISIPALVSANTKMPYQRPVGQPEKVQKWQAVPQLITATAKRLASEIALILDTENMSFAMILTNSNGLIQQLALQGIGKGDVVAVMMERSFAAVVSIFSILRCGAVFLPIDKDYPVERTNFMLTDANVALILTDSASKNAVFTDSCATMAVNLADLQHRGTLAEVTVGEDDPAYIIYTSGSTGHPKGVVVSHGNLSHYIGWAARYYQADKPLCFALFSSLSFDLTITSLFVPLVSGGQIVIYPESDNPADITIRTVIEDNRVDIIKLTPAHLSLIQSMDFSASRLRALIVGGDDFKAEVARTLSTYFSDSLHIYNEYGPTEATVGCLVHQYQPEQDTAQSVPIGNPICGTEVFIYDSQFNLVPQGVTGEIFVAGKGLATGYLNQPELTSSRFIIDPSHGQRRLYRTGDLGRFNRRGKIEYLGRNDRQVKIHGVRIETAEIESALLSHPMINDAVVEVSASTTITQQTRDTEYCVKCGLAANHPGAQMNHDKVCRLCRVYAKQEAQAQAYYRSEEELQQWIAKIKKNASAGQDCIMLLSGGKDSSYALCKLVDMGLNPIVFTLDNGFISEGAKANIKRLVDRLGLELVVGETPAMNDIFVDSLKRFSNVCNGCFKTIYTLSMNLARQRGIKVICTGLSRGQIFETRVAHLFQQGCFDPGKIDQQIIDARKAYHRAEDIIDVRLDTDIFNDESIFSEIEYLDFFRYTDVTLDEMYSYLNNIAPWIRPSDTGRSTNCLINDAGIYVHKKERGYHNYALPYSWDVRLGHKNRDAALDELNDELDQQKVDKILTEIGYQSTDKTATISTEKKLIAYYVAPAEINKNTLQKHLSATLPLEYVPHHYIWLKAMPLTINGKVDRQALPELQTSRRELTVDYVAPQGIIEQALATLWSTLLGVDEVGREDNFFDLGGDSIVSIQIVAAAREQGIELSLQQIFDTPTIKQLAKNAQTIIIDNTIAPTDFNADIEQHDLDDIFAEFGEG